MDSHEREYLAAAAAMQEQYCVVPTPPVCVTCGFKRIPTWNVGATVTWTDDQGRHRYGHVVEIRLPEDNLGDIDAERRVYVIQTRDPVSLQRRHVELTHSALCEW